MTPKHCTAVHFSCSCRGNDINTLILKFLTYQIGVKLFYDPCSYQQLGLHCLQCGPFHAELSVAQFDILGR